VATPAKDERAADQLHGVVKSAERVLDLFEVLGRWDREMPHAELADALGIPKSSLTQVLRTLVSRGYVEFSPAAKTYRLGPAFSDLAQHAGQARNLIVAAGPFLSEITAATGESSALNLLRDMKAEVVATVSSPQRLVSHMILGDSAPLYATSGGKAILAHLARVLQEEYLASVRFHAFTPQTISSADELRRQIGQVRRDGIAYSQDEFTQGISGIAVAVLSDTGQPVGAVNVAMPSVRYGAEARARAGVALQRAAGELARHIGLTPGVIGHQNDGRAEARANGRRA
jgi:DNA-binding IclR family transcriptional regulator